MHRQLASAGVSRDGCRAQDGEETELHYTAQQNYSYKKQVCQRPEDHTLNSSSLLYYFFYVAVIYNIYRVYIKEWCDFKS